jgi:S-DNA-T family DNA segregation ATPase FtsK/SpoIIIE
MATTKKSSSSNRKTKKERMQEMEKAENFRREVILWIVVAISLLLFISNFGVGGKIGDGVSGFLFGVFGLLAYLFPIVLLVGSFFVVSNKGNSFAVLKVVSVVLLILFLCLFLSLISVNEIVVKPTEAFTASRDSKSGGGFLGGLLCYVLVPAFGKIGSYIIDIIVLIIAVVLLSGHSAIRGMQKGGEKVYHSAKESNERYQEYREYKAKEREKRRMDQKVSGVSADTAIPKRRDAEKRTDEIVELMPKEPEIELPEVKEEVHIPLTSGVEPEIPEVQTEEIQAEAIPSVIPMISGNFSHDISEEQRIQEVMPAAESKKPVKVSAEELEKEVGEVAKVVENAEPVRNYILPPVSLLKKGSGKSAGNSERELRETANKLQQTLQTFGVNVTVTNISCGPAVTRYEVQPEMGVKVSKIVGLADDIKLNLAAADIRIEAPIPGKAAVGIEVPNKENVTVAFRDLVESEEFKNSQSNITFAVGKDIAGKVKVTDIAKMPHLLIAGATGSGKSVCINTIIMSILYKADPNDVKLIMIDPKVVELSVYNGIPHLMIPVVTDPKKAAGALNWAVAEMTDRYQKFAEANVRDLKGYNAKVETITVPEGQERPQKMPQIVIIVDELADLMMVASNDVEEAICRLAQLARACGIHLIIATQRPSVNVITGLIKANMPSRIAFAVTSGVDSRTILDMVGAEKLLGKGDMLFYPQGIPKPLRVQGAFVSDKEVSDVVAFLTEHNGGASYSEDIQEKVDSLQSSSGQAVSISDGDSGGDGRDSYFAEAARIIIDKDKASIGMLQRYLKVGFNRAARIMDQLEEAGVVGPEEGTKPRKVLMNPEELDQYIEEKL